MPLCFRFIPILLLIAACGERGSPVSSTVTDSAGVAIVTSSAPAWKPNKAWVIETAPKLDIGGGDTDPHYNLLQVTGATRLGDGRIAVLAAGSSQLLLYDSVGAWIASSGRAGEGPGEFRLPFQLLRLPGDTLGVYDVQLRRLSTFGPGGAFLHSMSIAQAAGGAFVLGLARLPDGSWIGRSSGRFTPQSKPGTTRQPIYLLRLTPEFGPAADTIRTFTGSESWVESGGSGTNRFITVRTLPLSTSTVFAAHDSVIYGGDNSRYEINVYRPDGTVIRSIRRPEQRKLLTDAMLARVKADELAGEDDRSRAEDESRWAKMPKPGELPMFDDLYVDADGNLWVMEPRVVRSDPVTADVFDPTGRLLGSVALPLAFSPLEIGHDYILGIWHDDMDIQHVRMYRISRPPLPHDRAHA